MAHGCSCLANPTSGAAWIDDACEDAVRLARLQTDGTAWVAVCRPDACPEQPDAWWRELAGLHRRLLHHGETWLLTAGCAWSSQASGPGRTSWLAQERATLHAKTVVRSSAGGPALPLLIGAWTFTDQGADPGAWGPGLPGANLELPRRAWWRDADGRGWRIDARRVTADEDFGAVAADLGGPLSPTPLANPVPWPGLSTRYTDIVEDAVGLITDGMARKIVLARAVDEPVTTDEATALHRLAGFPQATRYAWDLADGGLFCGASPEPLLVAEGHRLTTVALAGTIARGDDEMDDLGRLAALLADTKIRKEHNLVVEHLVNVLRPRVKPFPHPATPHRRAAGTMLHLETVLDAELHRPDHLELLAALQPTPAVCGLPVLTTSHWITRHEGLDRGLYAGALGWFTPTACRAIVPLRGGILARDRKTARLFAGAGVLETSDAAAELAETELKFQTMRGVLR